MADKLTLLRPDDWHVHFRDGEMMNAVVGATARQFARAIVMPNLKPAVVTVEAYKRNNLLRVEVTSRDVAELAAELCGPLFAKTTGAQVPVDGGNDRVI